MAGKSIGELNVKIAADAKGFHNVIADSEKTLSRFAAKAVAPFALGVGAAGAISHPLETILAPLEKMTELIPGLDKFSFFLDPSKYSAAMKEVQENTMEIVRAAERLDIDPQFLKSLRLTAGPLADQLEPGLLKLLRFQGELRKGGEDVLSAGGRKATTIAEKWGFDPQELANMTSEEFVLKFAEQMKELGSQSERVAMAMDILGKSGAKLANVFAQGAEGIEKWRDILNEMGIDPKAMADIAKLVNYLEKLEKLEAEQVKNWEYRFRGGPRTVARLGMEQAGSAGQYLQQFAHYLDTFGFLKATPLFGLTGFLGGLFGPVGPAFKNPLFEAVRKKAEEMSEAPPVNLRFAEELAANTDAAESLEKLNASLDDQQEMLRLTDEGWGNLAGSMMALDKLFSEGRLDIEDFTDTLKRLNDMRDEATAKKRAEEEDKRIRQAIGGFKSSAEFAPVALAGSADAAAAINRQFAGTGMADLLPTAEQIRDIVKRQETRAEMIENLVRDVRGILNGAGMGPVTE